MDYFIAHNLIIAMACIPTHAHQGRFQSRLGSKNTVILIIRFSHGKMNTNHVMLIRYRSTKIRNTFFWENKFSATLLDIKDKSGRTCPYIVTCQTTYSVAPFEFGAEFLIQIWRQEKGPLCASHIFSLRVTRTQTTKVYFNVLAHTKISHACHFRRDPIDTALGR